MPQGANVVVQSQKIVVNPSTKSVAVINAGPQGPPGAAGPVGPPGPGVPDQYVKADGSVSMSGLLLGVGVWEAVQSRFGDGTSVQPVFVQGKGGSGYIAFFSNITDLATQGARTGYVGFVSNNLRIASELAGGWFRSRRKELLVRRSAPRSCSCQERTPSNGLQPHH